MKRALLVAVVVFSLAGPARAEGLRSDVLFLVPKESSEVAFLDVRTLQASPHYALLKQRFLPARFLHFERFLRSFGVDADKDLDWVAWSIVPPGPEQPREIFLGFAQGRFDPEKVQEHYAKQKLPMDSYRGLTLFPFGSGVSEQDLLFTFLDSSTLAFGTRASLELMLETRYGSHGNLGENQALFGRVSEVNGHAPVWMVFDENYTRLAMRRLLPEAAKFPQFTEAAKRFRGGLLRVDIDKEASVSFQAWCAQPADAQSFSLLLQAGLTVQSWNLQKSDPVYSSVLQRAVVKTAGDRLEIQVSLAESDLKALLDRRDLL